MTAIGERALRGAVGLQGGVGVALWAYAAHGAAPAGLDVAAPFLLLHAAAGLAAWGRAGRAMTAARLGLILGPTIFTAGVIAGRGAPIGGLLTIASWLVLSVSALEMRRTDG